MSFGGQNRKLSNIRYNHFIERVISGRLAFLDCVLPENWTFQQPSNICRFWPKRAKHDVIKTPLSQKFLHGFFWNFIGRRQIDAVEGTESFASISAAVLDLSRKFGRGTESAPPLQRARVCHSTPPWPLSILPTAKGLLAGVARLETEPEHFFPKSQLESPINFNQSRSRYASLGRVSTTEPCKNYQNPNI